jgi:hypothetical protein
MRDGLPSEDPNWKGAEIPLTDGWYYRQLPLCCYCHQPLVRNWIEWEDGSKWTLTYMCCCETFEQVEKMGPGWPQERD